MRREDVSVSAIECVAAAVTSAAKARNVKPAVAYDA